MALDLEKNVYIPNHAESNKVYKTSILLDGMINLTGKGARLGVMKISDAGTGNSIGRIQARRSDSVSYERLIIYICLLYTSPSPRDS